MSMRIPLHVVGRPCAAAIFLLLVAPDFARAALEFGAGGGIATHISHPEPFAPSASLAIRVPLTDAWSVTTQLGYERFDESNDLISPIVVPFYGGWPGPSTTRLVLREIYAPVGLGVRYTAKRPDQARARAFVECLATITWARYEKGLEGDFRTFDGPPGGVLSAEEWLPGVNVATGFRHPLSGPFAFEWGVRFTVRQAPGGSDVKRLGFPDQGSSTLTLGAAITTAR